MPIIHKPYDIDTIKSVMSNSSFSNIYYMDEIDSTNSWLIDNGQCGDICLSERQLKGRGRRGNNWVSPAIGNIYLSLCICISDKMQHRSLISLLSGIAIAEALEGIGLKDHGVKWPNDIYWQRKKMGGILIETSNQSDKFIIGIGLNVLQPEITDEEIKQSITSVDDAMFDSHFSRDELLIKILDRLVNHLGGFESLDFDQFKKNWKKWDILHGENVNFQHKGSVVSGTVTGIDEHGRLGVLDAFGKMNFYSSVDIKLDKKSIQNPQNSN